MEEITGTIDSLVLVSHRPGISVELELLGQVLGDVTVGAGVTFILTGVVGGDVIALEDSTTIINGYVAGILVNRGASVHINGSIGSLVDSDKTPSIITPESHIRDRR